MIVFVSEVFSSTSVSPHELKVKLVTDSQLTESPGTVVRGGKHAEIEQQKNRARDGLIRKRCRETDRGIVRRIASDR